MTAEAVRSAGSAMPARESRGSEGAEARAHAASHLCSVAAVLQLAATPTLLAVASCCSWCCTHSNGLRCLSFRRYRRGTGERKIGDRVWGSGVLNRDRAESSRRLRPPKPGSAARKRLWGFPCMDACMRAWSYATYSDGAGAHAHVQRHACNWSVSAKEEGCMSHVMLLPCHKRAPVYT